MVNLMGGAFGVGIVEHLSKQELSGVNSANFTETDPGATDSTNLTSEN